MHGKVLKIIASFKSDVHEATKPVVGGSSMLVLSFSINSVFSKYASTGKVLWEFTSTFIFFIQCS